MFKHKRALTEQSPLGAVSVETRQLEHLLSMRLESSVALAENELEQLRAQTVDVQTQFNRLERAHQAQIKQLGEQLRVLKELVAPPNAGAPLFAGAAQVHQELAQFQCEYFGSPVSRAPVEAVCDVDSFSFSERHMQGPVRSTQPLFSPKVRWSEQSVGAVQENEESMGESMEESIGLESIEPIKELGDIEPIEELEEPIEPKELEEHIEPKELEEPIQPKELEEPTQPEYTHTPQDPNPDTPLDDSLSSVSIPSDLSESPSERLSLVAHNRFYFTRRQGAATQSMAMAEMAGNISRLNRKSTILEERLPPSEENQENDSEFSMAITSLKSLLKSHSGEFLNGQHLSYFISSERN